MFFSLCPLLFRYGVAFYYHSRMHSKEPLETIVHVIPIGVMFLTAGAMFLECRWRSGVWTMLTRSYCLLTLGTWFSHVAFILYEHDKFPGRLSRAYAVRLTGPPSYCSTLEIETDPR